MYRRYRGRGLYKGKGGFWSDLWSRSVGLRSQLGDMARSSSNPYLQLAGRASQMLGTGAYEGAEEGTVVNNEIVDGGAGLGVPTFTAGGGEMGTIQISHKEYIADVFGPEQAGTFQNVTYGINPGLPNTFPWLSQVAANYEEYTIKQLIFTFRSTVTDFVASNGQVGTIILATQYNANDAPFQSKQDMMEYAGAVSAKCSQQVIAGVECDPAQLSGPPGKYTRSGPTPPDEDVKTYDLGTLNVATANTPGAFINQAVGELWVSYTIELRKPKFFVTRAQNLLTDLFISDQGTASSYPGNAKWAVGQQNRIGGRLTTQNPGLMPPPAAGSIYYVFPATFSGNVEVQLYGSTTDPSVTPFLVAASSGGPGITPISDIWVPGAGGTQGYWDNKQVVVALGASSTAFFATSRFHYKVVSPTSAASAVDNVLVIQGGNMVGWTISVTMYNTGLNYSRVQIPIMTNPVTGQIIDFPANQGTA